MDVVAVVLSFNHPDLTSRCVRSVLRHFAPDRIFLVHNGSRDDVVESLKIQFSQIQHLVLSENRGYSGGVNVGLKAAFQKAEWGFLITNDCELARFEPQAWWRWSACAIAPKIWLRRTGRIDSLGGTIDWSRGRLAHIKEIDRFRLVPKGTRYLPGTSFLVHREAFKIAGPIRESLHTFWEDVEWSVRAELKGVPLDVDEGIELYHGGGKTTRKDSYYTSYLYQRNRRRISREFASWRARPRLEWELATHLLESSLKMFRARRFKDLGRLWRAHLG